jgi:Tfp pilus assembly protein PilX
VRDQPRAITAPRGALRAGGERLLAAAHYPTDRCCHRCAAPRQHGRGMARRRAARNHHRGDHR